LGTELLVFYALAALAVAASVLVVARPNPMHSVLWLIVSFAALAAIYIQLHAPFAAVIQIIIYAGAIMVLFLFVVMLLNVPTEEAPTGRQARLIGGAGPRRFGAVLSVLLAVQLFWAFRALTAQAMPGSDAIPPPTVREIGVRLFQTHAFAFEATSVLILVAMVGAIILARKEPRQ
jgi:NADH-quinone oxidoreductase subunit J